MRVRIFVIISGFALFLGACGPTFTEGTVTAKNHHPARDWIVQQCQPNGHGGTICHPQPRHLAERWEVCFSNRNEERCADISRKDFDRAKVGEHFVLP